MTGTSIQNPKASYFANSKVLPNTNFPLTDEMSLLLSLDYLLLHCANKATEELSESTLYVRVNYTFVHYNLKNNALVLKSRQAYYHLYKAFVIRYLLLSSHFLSSHLMC